MKKLVVVGAAMLSIVVARAEDKPAADRASAPASSIPTKAPQKRPKTDKSAQEKAHSAKTRHDAAVKGKAKQEQPKPCEEVKPCAIE